MNEKLSLLMDSELSASEMSDALDLLKNNPDARDQWTVMQMAADAMSGLVVADDGFSISIIEKLHNVRIDPDYDPLAD